MPETTIHEQSNFLLWENKIRLAKLIISLYPYCTRQILSKQRDK